MQRVLARIDLEALAHNLGVLRRAAPASRIFAVVKADAYGHGLAAAAEGFAAADGFGVACVDEALALREAGVAAPIVVLEGAADGAELAAARRAGLELVVHADWQLALLERDGASGVARLWAKFDTGMHRLGFAPRDADRVRGRLAALGAGTPGLMSHLACADEPERPETACQIAAFSRLRPGFDGPASLANSAGALAHPAAHCDWVRPGLALYGISPFPGRAAADLGLRPAMTFTAALISVREVAAGEGVGYGGDWRAARTCRIGIASAGYGDGYPWRAAQGAHALVRGRRVALAGRVSMDMLALDLTAVPEAAPGDAVVLWGEGLAVEEIAGAAGTIPYELVCSVTRRVPRVAAAAQAQAQAV